MKRAVWGLMGIAAMLVLVGTAAMLVGERGSDAQTIRDAPTEMTDTDRPRVRPAPEAEAPLPVGTVHCFDVSDANGKPLRGARIRLSRKSFDWRGAGPGWRTVPGTRPVTASPDAKSTSDSMGRGAIVGTSSGVYHYDVSLAGYARAIGTLDLHAGGKVASTPITLAPGHTLAGRFVDDAGGPVPDLDVIVGSGDLFDDESAGLRFMTRTDAAGRFAIDSLAEGVFEVWTRDDHEGHQELGSYVVPGVSEVEFVVRRGPTIRGVVVAAESDRPLSDARIAFHDRPEVDLGWDSPDLRTTTGADGRFVARGRGWQSVRAIVVRAPGHLPIVVADDGSWRCEELNHPEERDIVVTVPQLGRVEGTVRGPKGPVEGARVELGWRDSARGRHTNVKARVATDADGRYVVAGVPPGFVRVVVRADGFAPSIDPNAVSYDNAKNAREIGADDGPLVWDAELVPSEEHRRVSETFHGRVETSDGSPAEGAHVWLTGSYRGWHVADAGSTVAGPDGRFEVTGEANAGSFHVSASLVGAGSGDADATRGEIVIRLGFGAPDENPRRRLHGTVRRPDGTPAAGAQIVVAQKLVHGKNAPGYRWDTYPRVQADRDGAFEMELPVEFYGFDSHSYNPVAVFALGAILPGHGLAVSRGIDLTEEETPDAIELTLPPAHVLEGTVVDVTGTPLSGASVSLRGARSGSPREDGWLPRYPPTFESATYAITGEDGRFRVPGLTPESYKVIAKTRGRYDTESVVSLPIDSPLRMISRRPSTIAGEVVDASGAAVPDAAVWTVPDDERGVNAMSATTDAAGRFRLEDVPEGPMRLLLLPPETRLDIAQTITDAVVAPSSGTTHVIRSATPIRGLVLDAQGEPRADVDVTASPHDDRYHEGWVETDADGRFVFPQIGRGLHDVIVAGDPVVRVRDVVPGEPLEIRPQGDAVIAGTVPGQWQENVRATRIEPSGDLSRRTTSTWVDRDGSFRLPGLAPGRYRVELGESNWDGKFIVARTVTVTAPRSDLRLEEEE